MKQYILHILIAGGMIFGSLFFSACAEEADDGSVTLPVTGLIIHNRSQFELEHLFIYKATQTYQESENLLESNLQPEEMIFHRLEEGSYLVTVSRRPNATADLLAYTIIDPVTIDRPKVIEYYDTEFRVYDLKLTVPTLTYETENNESSVTVQRTGILSPTGAIPFVEAPME